MVVCVCLSVTENSDHLVMTLQDGNVDHEISEMIGLVMTQYKGQGDKWVIGTYIITQFPPEVNSSAIISATQICTIYIYIYNTIKKNNQNNDRYDDRSMYPSNSINSSEVSLRAASLLGSLYINERTF